MTRKKNAFKSGNIEDKHNIVFVDMEPPGGNFKEPVDFLTGKGVNGTPAALKEQLTLYPGV